MDRARRKGKWLRWGLALGICYVVGARGRGASGGGLGEGACGRRGSAGDGGGARISWVGLRFVEDDSREEEVGEGYGGRNVQHQRPRGSSMGCIVGTVSLAARPPARRSRLLDGAACSSRHSY